MKPESDKSEPKSLRDRLNNSAAKLVAKVCPAEDRERMADELTRSLALKDTLRAIDTTRQLTVCALAKPAQIVFVPITTALDAPAKCGESVLEYMGSRTEDNNPYVPMTLRKKVNREMALPIVFALNPFGTRHQHRYLIDVLTQPITLGNTTLDRTNVFRALAEASSESFKAVVRGPSDMKQRADDLIIKVCTRLRDRLYRTLEKKDQE